MKIIFPQWYAAIGVTLLLMQLGFLGGWASPTIARLVSPNSPIPLSSTEASWVASLVNLGRFFGAIVGAVAVNYLGTKQSILVTLFPIAIGWLIIVFANAVEWLYISRFLSGLGIGMSFSSFPLYIGEVSITEIRGALISMATVGGPFGQIIISITGSYLSMSEAASINLGLCLFLIIIFYWLPESPHHLVKVGKNEEAKKSIDWYRAGNGVEKELEAVEKFVASTINDSLADKFREFKNPSIRKATFQIIALFTFSQICGLNSVIFYMETILKRAKCTLIDPSQIVIYVNICGTVAALLSIVLIDKFGRRFLILLSSIGITTSMIMMSTHFFLIDMNIDVTNLQLIPITSMFLYIIFFFIGLMPVPSAILSEIFPANVKCIAACIASLTGAIMAFISAKTYQPMVDLIGEKYVFMIFVICAVMIIPYALILMPETKGKSLQQIQDEFIKK